MNRALLLGSLFLRVSTVYGAATHGDLIAEGRRRNEEAHEKKHSRAPGKNAESSKQNSS